MADEDQFQFRSCSGVSRDSAFPVEATSFNSSTSMSFTSLKSLIGTTIGANPSPSILKVCAPGLFLSSSIASSNSARNQISSKAQQLGISGGRLYLKSPITEVDLPKVESNSIEDTKASLLTDSSDMSDRR